MIEVFTGEKVVVSGQLIVRKNVADGTRERFHCRAGRSVTCTERPGNAHFVSGTSPATAVPPDTPQAPMFFSRSAQVVVTCTSKCTRRASNLSGFVLYSPATGSLTRAFHGGAVNAAARAAARREEQKPRSEEELAKELDTLAAMAHYTRSDVWYQPVQTLGK